MASIFKLVLFIGVPFWFRHVHHTEGFEGTVVLILSLILTVMVVR